MAEVLIRTFIGHYAIILQHQVNIYLDKEAHTIDARLTSGDDPRHDYDSYEDITDGEIIYQYCEGTTLWRVQAQLTDPFAHFMSPILDSPSCIALPDECTLAITSIVATDETSQGANDGTITVTVTGSAGGTEYSLNNVDYQSSNVFTGLLPGSYSIYVRDVGPCLDFQISGAYVNAYDNSIHKNPSVKVLTNTSYWNAAFNNILFTYQKKDRLVNAVVYNDTTHELEVTVNAPFSAGEIALIQAYPEVYLSAGIYKFYRAVFNIDVNKIYFYGIPDLGDLGPGGFVAIPVLKENYTINTMVKSGSLFDVIEVTSQNTPDNTGLTRADLQFYLRSLVKPVDLFAYNVYAWIDQNLSAYYSITYRETWNGGAGNVFSYPKNFYVTYAAMQLGEKYGGNLFEYVTFANQPDPATLAKFLTDFKEPILNIDQPFDISFIYSEELAGKTIFAEFKALDVNKVFIPGGFDDSFLDITGAGDDLLINDDGSRLIISFGAGEGPIVQNITLDGVGICRLMPPPNYSAIAEYVSVQIYWMDGATRKNITELKNITLARPCPDDPFTYVKWINHLGTWDYFRFGYSQKLETSTKNDTIIERNILDWENDDGFRDLVSKSAGDKLIVGADRLNDDQINALLWLRKTIKCQVLVDKQANKWQTVIISQGNFKIKNTRYGFGSIEITLELVESNIQAQ